MWAPKRDLAAPGDATPPVAAPHRRGGVVNLRMNGGTGVRIKGIILCVCIYGHAYPRCPSVRYLFAARCTKLVIKVYVWSDVWTVEEARRIEVHNR